MRRYILSGKEYFGDENKVDVLVVVIDDEKKHATIEYDGKKEEEDYETAYEKIHQIYDLGKEDYP